MSSIFDVTGTTLKCGHWNSPGKCIIYVADTYAGAVLEILVHADLGAIPTTTPEWKTGDIISSRVLGDRWNEEKRTAVLLVPSVILQGRELNVVLNAKHPDFAGLWDPRLFLLRASAGLEGSKGT